MSKGSVEARDRQRGMTITGKKRTGSCDKRSGNGRQRWVAMARLGGLRQWRGWEVRGNGGVGGEWQWLGKRNGNSRER
jgi:hypothetical protein